MLRFIGQLVIAGLVCMASAAVVEAKPGVSYLRGVTVSGGGLTHPVTTSISVPDGGYEMRPLHAPFNGLFANPWDLYILHTTPIPYEVVLHYDYERYGGERSRAGLYDGDRLFFFPHATGGDPHATGGDWYEASPRVARVLREEIFWAMAPPEVRGVRGDGIDAYTTEALAAMAAAVLLLIGHRAWQSGNDPASPLEVEARMRDRPMPGGHLGV